MARVIKNVEKRPTQKGKQVVITSTVTYIDNFDGETVRDWMGSEDPDTYDYIEYQGEITEDTVADWLEKIVAEDAYSDDAFTYLRNELDVIGYGEPTSAEVSIEVRG